MNKDYTKIYHLSHTDLDGYGSQYMTRFLRHNLIDIEYYNANYEEVKEKISLIFKKIIENHILIKNYNKNINIKKEFLKEFPKILFLITDLSITEELAKKINNFIRGNTHLNLKIQVLDHHKSGLEIAKKNDWYFLDIKKCGASLTADFVNTFHNNVELKEHLIEVGSFIQAHDLWEEKNSAFHFSNFLSDIIFNLYFPDFLENQKREFLCNYIFNFYSQYSNSNFTVEEMETRLPLILNLTLSMFLINKKDLEIINDKNIRSLYKLYYYIAILFEKQDENFETLKIDNFKFKILYDMNSSCFQYFSHYYLKRNKNIDFLINIRDNGRASLRSDKKEDQIDLSIIANRIGKGGGHAASAGTKLNFKRDVYSYSEVIKEIKNILKNINGN